MQADQQRWLHSARHKTIWQSLADRWAVEIEYTLSRRGLRHKRNGHLPRESCLRAYVPSKYERIYFICSTMSYMQVKSNHWSMISRGRHATIPWLRSDGCWWMPCAVVGGGQRARVSLAREVYADGDLYLLDQWWDLACLNIVSVFSIAHVLMLKPMFELTLFSSLASFH